MADSGGIVKIGIIGVAGFLAYKYLQSSGLWSQLFGGNSFTDPNSLLTYCTQNPTGSAVFNGTQASCAQWLQAAHPSSATPVSATTTPVTTTPVTTTPVQTTPVQPAANTSTLVSALNAAMPGYWNPQAGQSATFAGVATVSQWNWLMNNVTNPGSAVAMLSLPADQQIDAQTYVNARQAAGFGLSGISAYSAPWHPSRVPSRLIHIRDYRFRRAT